MWPKNLSKTASTEAFGNRWGSYSFLIWTWNISLNEDRHQPQHLDLDPSVGSHVQVDMLAPVQDILLSSLE